MSAADDAIRDAIATHDPDAAMVGDFVLLAETYTADGERMLLIRKPDDAPTWRALGLVHSGLRRLEHEDDQGWQSDAEDDV